MQYQVLLVAIVPSIQTRQLPSAMTIKSPTATARRDGRLIDQLYNASRLTNLDGDRRQEHSAAAGIHVAVTSRGKGQSRYPVFSCPPAFAFKSAMIIGPSENSDCSVRLVRSRK
ncbi:hypothetical protein PDO_4916 [Rhizobium sp. PDO1-076]|nr:hypothetical protein PDO_4916 [Rhizobium sp. PDO1-076]